MSVKENLQKARELITDPKCWNQGEFAKNVYGDTIQIQTEGETFPGAVCWCAWGALKHVVGYGVSSSSPEMVSLRDAMCGMSVYMFNDSSTHEEVLAAFDKAIEGCEEP